jgi:phosphatidylglycerol:prolipoprotein diacylglycerol transferase
VIFPNIDPVVHIGPWALQWGPLALRWYALAYVAGILLGWRYAIRLTRTQSLWGGRAPTATPLQIDDLVLWITLGIILGGRIGYILFYMLLNQDQRIWLAAHPMDVFKIWEGGMSFHGGFLGVCAAIALFARRNRIDILKLGDLIAPVAPIGLFFGRIANFINGELWGRPTDVPWAMIFPNVDNLPRHPSQLYQFGLEGVLLFVILWTYALRPRPMGAVSGLFLFGYGAFRFIAEYSREPDAFLGFLAGGLTMGQWLSVPMMIAGAALMLWAYARARKPQPTLMDRMK